jgi:S1-C subfamily serine protease
MSKTLTKLTVLIVIALSLVTQDSALGQQTSSARFYQRTSPEGSVYDCRTFRYDSTLEKVVVRAEYAGMTTAERQQVLQPKKDGEVWYPGNLTLKMGSGRWVSPSYAKTLRAREETARLRAAANKKAVAAQRLKIANPAKYYSDNNGENLRNLIAGATVHIKTPEGSGSGVITVINRRKYVLTANHVTKGASSARIESLKDGSFGTVYRESLWNVPYDVAILPLPSTLGHLPAVPLVTQRPQIGQPIYLSGFPEGEYRLSPGRIAGFRQYGNEMLHTANSASGASGGMLITPNGSLIGIHTGVYISGSSLSGYKSATPASVVVALVRGYSR